MSFNVSTLMKTMSREEYLKACSLTKEQCDAIARMEELPIQYDATKKPGQTLVKLLDTRGYSFQDYERLMTAVKALNLNQTYYKPCSKVAILIANQTYDQLSKLVTPILDCEALGAILRKLGFIVIIVKNTKSSDLKQILINTISMIPENSYCFIFYAGHGCELSNVRCMLGTECPPQGIDFQHCITDNFVLQEISKCKPDLGILIIDSCRVHLDRSANPTIYSQLGDVEDFKVHKYLTIAYSTTSSASAYELAQIYSSTLIDENVTYNPRTGDTDKITPGSSQYVQALCSKLEDNLDLSSILDKVHAELETAVKKQIAIKVQYGAAKRSLHDPVTGNTEELFEKLSNINQNFKENYFVSYERTNTH